MSFELDVYKNLRQDYKFPSIWCPGCGIGTVMHTILKAIDKLDWDKDKIVFVGGIGCSSRVPFYVNFDALHTTHGRPIAFATGIKFANPDLKVIVVAGDGDSTAIGGNHFIHACRRNIDLTLIVINNSIYGMTGGQYSPTTFSKTKATTAPYGMVEKNFNVVELAKGAGATYIARSTVYHAVMMENLILNALKHEGMSVVDVLSPCWTTYGRRNKFKTVADMWQMYKDITVPIKAWDKLPEEKKEGKLPIGEIFVDNETPEYTKKYYEEIISKVKGMERKDFSIDIDKIREKMDIQRRESFEG